MKISTYIDMYRFMGNCLLTIHAFGEQWLRGSQNINESIF